jgi:paraquat-inducible protein A
MTDKSETTYKCVREYSARSLVLIAGLLFGMALVRPIFSVTPGAGDFTGWLRLISPEVMETSVQTLPGGIRNLWVEGDPALACILIIFCILLPLLKFTVIWAEAIGVDLGSEILAKVVRLTAPYAMVEVFLLALIVMIVKGLPGGSEIRVEGGAWMFCGSVLLSLVAARLASKRV